MMKGDFYPIAQIARRLGITTDAVRLMCIRGDLPHMVMKNGTKFRYYVPADELEALLSKSYRPSNPEKAKAFHIIRRSKQ